MGEKLWRAERNVGAFRLGHLYRSSQLGVLGRMAVKAGHLQYVGPAPDIIKPSIPAKKAVAKKAVRRKPKVSTKGWADGEVEVRMEPGGTGQDRHSDGPTFGSADD